MLEFKQHSSMLKKINKIHMNNKYRIEIKIY